MSIHRAPAIALVVVAVLVAACGGGGTTSSGPSQAASSNPSQGASTEPSTAASAAASEAAPSASAAASPAASQGGGTSVGDACELVTAAEAAQIMGLASTTTMATPGDVSYCLYGDPSGGAAAATSFMSRGGSGAFTVWKTSAGVQQIDGLGDDAVFDPSSATLLMLKGDAIFSVSAGTGADDESQRLDWEKAFAEKALSRL
jgi:hypothetical protein